MQTDRCSNGVSPLERGLGRGGIDPPGSNTPYFHPFGPKMAEDSPKMALRWHQDGSKMQDSPKMAHDGFKMAHDGPKWPQDGFNLAPLILKNGALA